MEMGVCQWGVRRRTWPCLLYYRLPFEMDYSCVLRSSRVVQMRPQSHIYNSFLVGKSEALGLASCDRQRQCNRHEIQDSFLIGCLRFHPTMGFPQLERLRPSTVTFFSISTTNVAISRFMQHSILDTLRLHMTIETLEQQQLPSLSWLHLLSSQKSLHPSIDQSCSQIRISYRLRSPLKPPEPSCLVLPTPQPYI